MMAMTRMDLFAEMHNATTLLMSAHSELRRKYGLSPDFDNGYDRQACDALVSVLEGWKKLDDVRRNMPPVKSTKSDRLAYLATERS